MDYLSRYQKLNSKQQQAVDSIDGPIIVLAGPGTGKTELLSMRAANILRLTDTLPENILCLTFTESGQEAMRQRLVDIIGKDAYKVPIHTFHSFGSDIMAHNREYFYNNALFNPADDLQQYQLLRAIFEALPPSSSLSSQMNGEYTHTADARKVISELKRQSALTSDELLAIIHQNEEALDFAEKLISPIAAKITKSTVVSLRAILAQLQDFANGVESLHEVMPLAQLISESLTSAVVAAENGHPTKPLTAWKNQWLQRDEAKKLVFKDRKRLQKLREMAYVYYEYLNRMEQAGLYDYDDMIMQVVVALELHSDLRFNLQEKYLYIMVDEFQDTNLAQLRILHALTNNPVNEGAPNILVVGDDDQAVYGFQGADVSTVLNFSQTYPGRQLIVLTDNYRSQGDVLAAARAVITQGSDRLENRLPELSKELSAKRDGRGTVQLLEAATSDDERAALAGQIADRLKQGQDPASIAVLARRHSDIQSLLPSLQKAGVPVRYERQESVLDSAPILILELVAKILVALAQNHHAEANALMPQLLAHPAWQLAPADVWRLSLNAYSAHQQWLEVMQTTPEFVPLFDWLIHKSQLLFQTALEPMIDLIIGPKSEVNDSSYNPLFDYYFNDQRLQQDPEAYLDHLNALRSIRSHLKEYKPGSDLTLIDFVEFIDLRRRLNLGITSYQYSAKSGAAAVNLLTAHKAKGLEFDTVYVFNAVDAVWGQSARSHSRSISYPKNLPLEPAGNSADERLRLFYVAMTRAKNDLIITYSGTNDTLKPSLLADFLLNSSTQPTTLPAATNPATRQAAAEQAWYTPLLGTSHDLPTVLAPSLQKFKLSATSLNNFLNVASDGPRLVLLENLLKFPRTKNPAAAYGTAVHWTMRQAHSHLNATGEQKPLEDSLHDFEMSLANERLSPNDHAFYLQKGSEQIPIFLNSGALPLNNNQKPEVSFSHLDVRLGEACLTGSLDIMEINKSTMSIEVTDYKTGHPSESWFKGDDRTKQKLHRYRQQLLFYKILVEQSAPYSSYTVTKGQLAFIEPTKAGETIILPLETSDLNATIDDDLKRTAQLIAAVWRHIQTFDFPDVSHYSPDIKGIEAFEQDLIDGLI